MARGQRMNDTNFHKTVDDYAPSLRTAQSMLPTHFLGHLKTPRYYRPVPDVAVVRVDGPSRRQLRSGRSGDTSARHIEGGAESARQERAEARTEGAREGEAGA